VVLPAYNEQGNIEPLVDEIIDAIDTESLSPLEIIVVDDGSTDGTGRMISDLATRIPELTAVVLSRNFGQSAALAAGIDISTGDYVVTMDADGQNDPADIPKLIDKLEEGYGCVSGWRRDRQDPLSKRIPSEIQTHLAMRTGPQIHDFGCTLKAYDGDAVREIDLYGEGHRYIPAKLHKRGYSVTELEVNHRPRTYGSSKYGLRRLVRGFVDLLFQLFWNRFSTRPLHVMGGGGILLGTVGAVIGSHAVIMKYLFGVSLLTKVPRLLLAVALILFGGQLLVFGFLAEVLTKLYYRNEKPYRIQSVRGAN
jgi:glycosyltransferase involved in cell wall biosynthesis